MTDSIDSRPPRRDDGAAYRWLPAIVTVITVGIAWGTLTANVGRLDSAAQASDVERRALREQAIKIGAQLELLNAKLRDSEITTDLVSTLAETVGRVHESTQRNAGNVEYLWINIDILADAIRAAGGSVTLHRKTR